MSRLDDELLREVGEAPAEPRADPSPPPAPEPRRIPRRNAKFVVVLLALGVAGLAAVLMSFESSTVYSKGVDELLAGRQRFAGRTVRVEGTLVRGSLERQEQPCSHRFQIARNGAKLRVDYPECVLPDTFRDLSYTDVGVTAEGKLDSTGRFQATRIMTRCPSKYETRAKEPGAPPDRLSAAPGATRQ
jgi:cytochrome c-type biogenesis protein CcmE